MILIKNFAKILDIPPLRWYNKITERERKIQKTRKANKMTRAELITLAKETLAEIFDSAKYDINVTPTRKGNGAYICVKEIVKSERFNKCWNEYYQVGYNKAIYAIAGEENVIKAIKKAYMSYAA